MNIKEREMQLNVVVEEWKDLREEVKRRIDQRTIITQFIITLVSALLTTAVLSGNLYIISIIPFATAYCLYHIKASYFVHHWLVTYIRERIEDQKMRKVFPNSDVQWLSWETYYKNEISQSEKERASRRRFYNLLEVGLYLGCGVVFTANALQNLSAWLSVISILSFWVLGFVAVTTVWMIDPYKERLRHNDEC